MFEKLIEFILQQIDLWSFAHVVDAHEGGVILRWGKYARTIGPGFNWKWPLMEKASLANTCTTTQRLPAQTLTTKDGQQVVVEAIVRYAIRDPKPYLTEVWDSVDVLADTTMGAIRLSVADLTYADLLLAPPEPKVLESVRKAVNRYGFKIDAVTFTSLGRIRSLRLLTGVSPPNLAN